MTNIVNPSPSKSTGYAADGDHFSLSLFAVPTFQALTYDELGLLSYRILPTPDNVYKGVIEKPLIVVSLANEKPSFQFAPGGLRGLLKDPQSKQLVHQLTKDDQITVVIYQKSSLPSAIFPEKLQAIVRVPEYQTTLETLMEPPPVVMLIRKNQLKSLNLHTNLGQVGGLIVQDKDIRVDRDERQLMNHFATTPSDNTLYLVHPETRYSDNHAPAALHFPTPIPALPPLNIPNNVGPFYI
ncbi:uncharacterized protein LOC120349616 [Nilaparvata lugens]|uniref:uncharacterized protein LOC120349616 n=1 Tax=Nilaparvata lugens TaxID=108931 RepID=UPI00193E263B|nr:uncharacterized protein LOC120349616 [Nilaparvata lugens]